MKFFISSRMKELVVERKTTVEAIHIAGHTPIYIETEPIVKDNEARKAMDSLLKDSDGLISIHYLTLGRPETVLDNLTPIRYELEKFRVLKPDGPIFMFRLATDQYTPRAPGLVEYFDEKANELGISKPVEFLTPADLDRKIIDALKEFENQRDSDDLGKGIRYIIRYSGPDFMGLIAKASEIIFTSYRLNIDYISHAAHGGLATLYASCSPRDLVQIGNKALEDGLSKGIEEELKKAKPNGRLIDENSLNTPISITVDEDHAKLPPVQFYVELRAINAPGQLNALCKVLLGCGFNIDEIEQKPTPPEYKRQASICLWLSKPKWTFDGDAGLEVNIEKELRDLEMKICYLVGIRSYSLRVVKYR